MICENCGRILVDESLSVAVMRRLVESNFTLRYSRFALDNDNNLVIKFDSAALDASPYKLYYALKEVAINADKQDDLLLDEFRTLLKPIDMGSKIEISTAEKEAKYTFLMGKIQGVLAEIDTQMLDAARYPGGISYLLLNLAYSIDYLITPEGFIMETIERIHRSYFAKEGAMLQKNITIRKEFEKIINRDKTLIFNELYNTTSTFGVLQPKGHEALVSLIDGELQNMNWYEENKHINIALSVPSYIVGHALFCYTLPKPDRTLLELYYQIFEPHYFNALGGEAPPQYFEPMTGIFDQNLIKNAIKSICNPHIDTFYPVYPYWL